MIHNRSSYQKKKCVCSICKKANSSYVRAYQIKAMADGKCKACYKLRGENGTALYCRSCADKSNERFRKWWSNPMRRR